MRSNVNEGFLAKRTRWARILSFAGLGCLVASAALMNRMLILSWGILMVGLLVSSSGAYLAARYVREPTAQWALEKTLKGFDDRHVLYNYLLPVEHVLVTPSGVWVIRIKKQPGHFSYDGKKWRQKFTLSRLLSFLGEPGLGNPIRDIERDIDTLSEKLAQEIPATEVPTDGVIVFTDPIDTLSEKLAQEIPATEVPTDGVIVFTDPRASLDVTRTAWPVITHENLKSFFRRALADKPSLPPEIQKELARVFDEWAS